MSDTPLRRNRDFVLLHAGQLLSTAGANISRIAFAADIVSASAVGVLAAAILTHRLTFWHIAAVAFVDSTASVFFMAAQSGAFRSIVPRAQLPAAASVAQGRAATVRLAGPPLGGALFAVGRAARSIRDVPPTPEASPATAG
jgi:hypothetical protein